MSALMDYLGVQDRRAHTVRVISEANVLIMGAIEDVEIVGATGPLSWNIMPETGNNVDGDAVVSYMATDPFTDPPIEPPQEPAPVTADLDAVLQGTGGWDAGTYDTIQGWRFYCGPLGNHDEDDPITGNPVAWAGGVPFIASMEYNPLPVAPPTNVYIRCRVWSAPITIYIVNAVQIGGHAVVQPYRYGDGALFTIHSPLIGPITPAAGLFNHTAFVATPFDLRNEQMRMELQPLLQRNITKQHRFEGVAPRRDVPGLLAALAH